MAIPPVQPRPERESASGVSPLDPAAFRLETTCPECAAPVVFYEEDVSTTCEYCDSLLVLELEGREPCFYLPTRLTDSAKLVETLATHLAMRQRPTIANRYSTYDSNGNVIVPTQLVDAEVRRLEKRYLDILRVQSTRIVYAPYQLCLGELGQAYVGRYDHGGKGVSFRVYALEYTLRGYPAGLANLRDKGLKLDLSRLRLLTPAVAAGLEGKFLKTDRTAEAPVDRARRLLARPQDRELAPIVPPRSELLFIRQSFVYKPFLFVEVSCDGRPETVLVDGSTEQLAGTPGSLELVSIDEDDHFEQPLEEAGRLEGERSPLQRFPSECPVCGHEQQFDRRAHLQLCHPCNRALEVRPDGIKGRSYRYVEAPDGATDATLAWVPFFRFELALHAADGRVFDSLVALHEEIFRNIPIESSAGSGIVLPAVRCMGHPSLDSVFERLAWTATHDPPTRLSDGPMQPDTPGRRVNATLDEGEARQLAPLVLYTLLDKARRSRVNMPKAKNLLSESRLVLSSPELWMLPLPLDGEQARLGKEPFGISLIEKEGSELNLRQRIRYSV